MIQYSSRDIELTRDNNAGLERYRMTVSPAVPRDEPHRDAECGSSYDEEKQQQRQKRGAGNRERSSEDDGRSMPPVLGGAAMAVLPVSPQTATQGNPHHHHNHHVHQGQTQVLLAAAGAATQAQPQLLYQPYNLMPAAKGKVISTQPGKRHGMVKRSKSNIRNQRGTTILGKSDSRIVKLYMPYEDVQKAVIELHYKELKKHCNMLTETEEPVYVISVAYG
ncbi:50S ribosomal protein L35 [Habropoda laboriosa]|uniref:50S ribosomal protein L35 n=1 Tax=Habropoda laboriosa TaxID=597456 RepID=A0A0L7RHL9_9HYME|nr:50S ribosomal protein L35 [Habropoda laboriosa]